jgi:hypothetical protein
VSSSMCDCFRGPFHQSISRTPRAIDKSKINNHHTKDCGTQGVSHYRDRTPSFNDINNQRRAILGCFKEPPRFTNEIRKIVNASRHLKVLGVSHSHATDNTLVQCPRIVVCSQGARDDKISSGWPVNVPGAVDATQNMCALLSLELLTSDADIFTSHRILQDTSCCPELKLVMTLFSGDDQEKSSATSHREG